MTNQRPSADLQSPEMTPVQFNIDLEIIDGIFDRENSPDADGTIPSQISVNENGYTTVTRENRVSTLYDPQGKIVDSVPEEYVRMRKTGQKEIPVVRKQNGSVKIFFSADRADVLLSGNPYHKKDKSIYINENKLSEEALDALIKLKILEWGSNNFVVLIPPRKNEIWREMIQKGNIQFLDETHLPQFSVQTQPPTKSPVYNKAIPHFDWIAHDKDNISIFKDANGIFLYDWSDNISGNWSKTKLVLPNKIKNPTAAGLDPKGNFLLVGQEHTLYILDRHSEPMKIVALIEDPKVSFHGAITVLPNGNILVGDSSGNLTQIVSNLETFSSRREILDQRRTLALLRSKKRKEKVKTAEQSGIDPEIQEIAEDLLERFREDVENAQTLDDISIIKAEVSELKSDYENTLKNKTTVEAIFKPLSDVIRYREQGILSQHIEEEMTTVRKLVARIDTLSLVDLAEARTRIDRVKSQILNSDVDPAIKSEIAQISDTFLVRSTEVLGDDEDKLIAQLDKLLNEAKTRLGEITAYSQFEVWESTDYPAFLDAMSAQLRIVPSSHGKVIKKIREIENSVRELKKEASLKFKQHYEEVRQQAASHNDVLIGLTAERIDEFLESFTQQVRKKSFRTTEEAKQWIDRSLLYASVLELIEDLSTKEPEKSDELKQKLKVEIAQITFEIKQGSTQQVDQVTGRQMVRFGKEQFPVWEHKIPDPKSVKVELTYKVDNTSKGPGIAPDDYMCEIFFKVTDEKGGVHEVPMHNDDTTKYGRYNDRFSEKSYFPSYLKLGHARKMIANLKSFEGKNPNAINQKAEEFRNKIRELNNKISLEKQMNGGDWEKFREERSALTREYVDFLHETGLFARYALKGFKNGYLKGNESLDSEGQGRIPDWAPYWIVDKSMEEALETFAEMSKMSLKNREGLISLEGHAGTGKDVLVQMFAHKTKRPLYSFDCTKWTTEFDLSQDVSLAAEDGASYTIKEDSVIVKALETPGAILYFNEFNAMPEQAQIFLHSLFDAKRQVTLKTSSGRIVKAHPSVIICSSMNPGYPGTNHPQFATRSRMIPLKLEFPEFRKPDGTYEASEALRIARSVKSLQELTYNPDMAENEFVQLWDQYINRHISNGQMTPERQFDLEVIFALITFATKIREGFINKISKKSGPRAFTISQPFTLREMRRCAYILSTMDQSQKTSPDNAEAVAKDLIRKFYSQYIFDEKEAHELETHLAQWTVEKP